MWDSFLRRSRQNVPTIIELGLHSLEFRNAHHTFPPPTKFSCRAATFYPRHQSLWDFVTIESGLYKIQASKFICLCFFPFGVMTESRTSDEISAIPSPSYESTISDAQFNPIEPAPGLYSWMPRLIVVYTPYRNIVISRTAARWFCPRRKPIFSPKTESRIKPSKWWPRKFPTITKRSLTRWREFECLYLFTLQFMHCVRERRFNLVYRLGDMVTPRLSITNG